MGGTAHLVCTAARSRSQFVNLQDYTAAVFYMPWKPFGSVRRFFRASLGPRDGNAAAHVFACAT